MHITCVWRWQYHATLNTVLSTQASPWEMLHIFPVHIQSHRTGAWEQPWREYLHHGNWQTLQIRSPKSQLFIMYWPAPCFVFLQPNTFLTNVFLVLFNVTCSNIRATSSTQIIFLGNWILLFFFFFSKDLGTRHLLGSLFLILPPMIYLASLKDKYNHPISHMRKPKLRRSTVCLWDETN